VEVDLQIDTEHFFDAGGGELGALGTAQDRIAILQGEGAFLLRAVDDLL